MIQLEHVTPGDWQAVERIRLLLQSLVPDAGGRSVGFRFGDAGAVAAGGNKAVSHGLGKTPVAVFATGNVDCRLWVTAVGATQFTVNCAGAAGTTVTYWLVIG